MQNAFIRWLSGTPPRVIGAWWDEAAVCLVYIDRTRAFPVVTCSYEPVASAAQSLESYQHLGLKNALRLALDRLGRWPVVLALGVPAAEVFTKTTVAPAGLDDEELAQLCLVEAVVNLPVPPEEVCADFLRDAAQEGETQAQVRIAFCRREIVDELILTAEDAGTSLAVVDRDAQAIHDATQWLMEAWASYKTTYPLAILLETEPMSILIARDELDLVQYVVTTEDIDLVAQIGLCMRRSGIADHDGLKRIVILQNPSSEPVSVAGLDGLGVECCHLNPFKLLKLSDDVPVIALMTALGMALRNAA